MEHSRLLKFILPEGSIIKTKMADSEPVKNKFEYKNPNNVEAEVPEAQELRVAVDNGEVPQKSKLIRNNSHTGTQGAAIDKGHGKLSRRHSTQADTNGKDKNDEKKAKTKIPVSRFKQTVEMVKAERRASKDKKEQESHIPIRRSSIPKQTSKAPKKPIRKSIAIKTEVVEPNAAPEDEFDKLYEEAVHSPTPINIDVSLLDPKIDDPVKLESKFEEIIHDYDENRVQPIDVDKIKKSKIPFLKRRSQQEFDVQGRSGKIIAARDKLRMRHSVDLNDVKGEEVQNYTDDKESKSDAHNNVDTDKTLNAREHVDQKIVKPSESGNDVTFNDQNGVTVEKLVTINTAVVNKGGNTSISTEKTKTVVATSSKFNEDNESTKLVGSTTITETIISQTSIKEQNTKGQITEDNIQKDFIKIGIPVFDSYVHEHTEKIETEKTVEVKNVLSYANNEDIKPDNFEANVEIVEINNEPIITEVISDAEQSIVEIVDKIESPFDSAVLDGIKREIEDTKVVPKENKDSLKDIANLRGKVTRLINKIDSHEPIEANKIDFASELPKKKSVMSKIAMFERHESEPDIKSKIPKKDTKLPKLFSTNIQRTEKVHIHTPLIVDEVFKPFEAKTNSNITVNKVEITTNGDNNVTEPVRAEMVIIESPETVLYNIEAKAQIESNALRIQQFKIAEEVLTPVLRKDTKVGKITNENNKESIFKQNKTDSVDIPVIVPKFIPVKEVLKRYESISSHDAQVNNKSAEDLPKIRPIIEIISQLKPDTNHRSLDAMFAHQAVPASDILNDLKSENNKEEKTMITEKDKNKDFTDEAVSQINEKARQSFKSRDYDYKTQELKVEKTIIKGQNFNKDFNDDDVFQSNEKTRQSFKSRDYDYKTQESKFEKVTEQNLNTDFINEEVFQSNEKTRITEQNLNTDFINDEVFHCNDKAKQSFKSKDYDHKTQEFEQKSIIRGHNVNKDFINDEVLQTNEKTFKSRDYDYKTQESKEGNFRSLQFIQDYHNSKRNDELKRAKSVVELDLGDAVKGKVSKMIVRINSHDKLLDIATKEAAISLKEMPRKRSVSEKIALFERKLTPAKVEPPRLKQGTAGQTQAEELTADIQARIAELAAGKLKYGKMADMPRIVLANGVAVPAIALGTALLDPRLAYHIVSAAIDLGYRAIDTAYIYGNEKVVGEAIRAKINDGTVTREELFIISKLWSTYHRTDLVKVACEASLAALGLDYFDLYLVHNPMSFKEEGSPLPKIATVLQYSEYDFLDAWFGMEALGPRARAIGVSNFNSAQIKRVLDRARVKPVVNQVECHPYLSQQRLDDFCAERNITLSCFGVLGSKGTPVEYTSGVPAAIDDALVQVMASGLNVSPAQLLIRYQLECGHQVVVKSSSAAHLWDNLQALTFNLTSGQMDALHALNRNKRIFSFRGMGDTHKNYPFNMAF